MTAINVKITTKDNKMVSKNAKPLWLKIFLCRSIKFGRFLKAVIKELTPLEAKNKDKRKIRETELFVGFRSVICLIVSVIKKYADLGNISFKKSNRVAFNVSIGNREVNSKKKIIAGKKDKKTLKAMEAALV